LLSRQRVALSAATRLCAGDPGCGDLAQPCITCGACAQVIQDLHDECGKYGSVVAVAIPRPPDPATAAAAFGTGNFGKVCLSGQLNRLRTRTRAHGNRLRTRAHGLNGWKGPLCKAGRLVLAAAARCCRGGRTPCCICVCIR